MSLAERGGDSATSLPDDKVLEMFYIFNMASYRESEHRNKKLINLY